jgi:hypothetical protein
MIGPNSFWNLSCLLAVVTTLFAVSPRASSAEPRYQGKALSEWLDELDGRPTDVDYAEAQRRNLDQTAASAIHKERAEKAIRQIGTNGVPTLLEILGTTERTRRKVLSHLENRDWKVVYRSRDVSLVSLRNTAVDGFAVLGTNAEFAISQIEKLFLEDDPCFEAAHALVVVGPKGINTLIRQFDRGGGPRNNPIILALGKYGPKTKEVTDILIEGFKDPNPANHQAAGATFEARDPAAIPVVIEMLKKYDDVLSVEGGCEALQAFGPRAKEAAPLIFQLFTNHVIPKSAKDDDIRAALGWGKDYMSVLKAIDLETAIRAQTFLTNSSPLNYARGGYTITPLKDGKVLVAGGSLGTELPVGAYYYLSMAQLLDPKTGKWEETGSMKFARVGHRAVRLTDGRVLVAGGGGEKGKELNSAEIYNPASGKWTETNPKNRAGYVGAAVLRSDGKALFFDEATDYSKGRRIPYKFRQELYDPANEKWTVLPDEKPR